MREQTDNNFWYYLALRIVAIVVIALAAMIFIVPDGTANTSFGLGIIVVTALSLIYGVLASYLRPKADGKTQHGNPYHNFFFRGTAVLTMVLTLLGILGAFFVYIEHNNLFQAVGLITSVIWIGAFLMYFMWAVYHYNINYGLTDQDWEKIFEAEERRKQGFPVKDAELEAPKNNPYRSQTFGLPPGTVRGMIAFTLLIGGMSLLIVSFGTEYTGAELALVRQQFEFFETAFLMMIAFYFGDKSLRYLRDRWKDPNRGITDVEGGSPPKPEGFSTLGQPGSREEPEIPRDDVFDDDQEFLKQEVKYAVVNDTSLSSAVQSPPAKKPSGSLDFQSSQQDIEYVQILDNLHQKVLSDGGIKDALEELQGAANIQLSLPVVKAIIDLESSGRGHLPDGRAKILFEGHKFWYWLEKEGMDPASLQKGNEHILYKTWTRANYRAGAGEYERLAAAKLINEKAAIYSTSWGLFQILGENLESFIKERNYKDVHQFEEKQHQSEYYHFLDFLAFIKTKKVRGKAIIHYVSEENHGNYDWASFAYGYNGSGYAVNQYDVKLKKAYEKHKKEEAIEKASWIPILDAGYGGLVDGQYQTSGKQYHFTDGTLVYEGVINRAIGRLLAEKLKAAAIPFLQTSLETEADLELSERVGIANSFFQTRWPCYLLSIHSNSSSDETMGDGNAEKGFEVYTSIGLTKSDELATIASKWYKKLFPEFPFRETKTAGSEGKNKEAAYTVLTKTRCPAFMVKNLFYDNKDDALFLMSVEGQERIAGCLFQIVQEIYQTVKV